MIIKPKGTYDLLNEEAIIYNRMEKIINDYMLNYNCDYIRTPIFESSELFHRGVGETTDIVTKETYDFVDRGNRPLTLRPEGTAGVVRSIIENKLYGNRNETMKYYYLGTMYRYERPQSGRNREFTQFGVEYFNSDDSMSDAEVIEIGYNILKDFGINNVTVHLNSLGDVESRENFKKALVSYLNPQLDELCEDCQRRIKTNPLRIIDCKIDSSKDILKNAPKITDYLNEESQEKFKELKKYLDLLEIDYEIDPLIVRGLDYYDHFVWEYVNEEGITLGGGGRYNHLFETLDGPKMPAVGFALGLERIIIDLKKELDEKSLAKQIDAYILCETKEEKMHAIKIAKNLRFIDLVVEICNNNLSKKSQFKIADKLNARYLIMLNDEDLQKGIIKIKDNETKEEFIVDEEEVVDFCWEMM